MKTHHRAQNQGVRAEVRDSVRDQSQARKRMGPWPETRTVSGGVRGRAQLTDGTVGAGIARAGAVTLVAVTAKADTDALVLAWVVTTGVHCG